jgi:hypothetical protein
MTLEELLSDFEDKVEMARSAREDAAAKQAAAENAASFSATANSDREAARTALIEAINALQ